MQKFTARMASSALTILCLLTPRVSAAEAPSLPTDLDLVPRDAAGFVHLRVAQLWQDEAFADVRRVLEHAGPEALRLFDRKHVPAPSTIERVSLVYLTPESFFNPFPQPNPVAVSVLTVVSTSKPFDPDQLRQCWGGPTRTFAGKCYDLNERTWRGVLVVDNHTFVLGTEDALQVLLTSLKVGKKEGPLADALREAASDKHVLTAAINPRLFSDAGFAAQLPLSLQPLLKANFGLATIDLGKELKLAVHLHFPDADGASAGDKAARELLDLTRTTLQQQARDMEKQLIERTKGAPTGWQNFSDTSGSLAGLAVLRFADAALKEMPLHREGVTVGVRYSAGTVNPVHSIHHVLLTTIAAISSLGQNANSTFTFVGAKIKGAEAHPEMMRIAKALEKYHEEHGHYPPAAIRSKGGVALLSWRVAILPYLGEEMLYSQFKLDESWDSPHNKKLLLSRPQLFMNKRDSSDHWMSSYQVFTGSGTLFDGREGLSRKEAINGPANTLLVVATEDIDAAVPWSKPADVPFDKQQLIASPWDGKKTSFVALFADGTVRKIPEGTPEKSIRAWIMRNSTEIVIPPK